MAESYTRKPNTNCQVCSKLIYRRPCEIEKGHVFCSMTCYGISTRKEKPCLICGKLIQAHFNKKTCSRSCANINRAGMTYGHNRPHDKVKYQKGLKERLNKERGGKCERCSYIKLEILQVHHKDRNRSNNDLSNLELICPNCHYEEHYFENNQVKNRINKKVMLD